MLIRMHVHLILFGATAGMQRGTVLASHHLASKIRQS